MCNAHNHSLSCQCGWGGTGHTGLQHNIIVNGSSITWMHYKDDFCKPSNCPICRAPVFFVRHNGGSVWFDALGKPWPKHGCFDKNTDVHQITWRLMQSAEGVTAPLYGLVIAVEISTGGSLDRIIVKCEDNALATVYVPTQNNHGNLVGELVILSHTDKKIIHPHISASTVFSFPDTAYQHYHLGKIYVGLGCTNDAVAEFERGIALQTSFAEAYIELGKLYEGMRRYFSSGSEKSMRMKRKITEVYFLAGQAFRKRKKLPEALQAYRRVLLLSPSYPGLSQELDCCRDKQIPEKPVAPRAIQRPQQGTISWRQQPALNVNYNPKPNKAKKR